MEGRNVGTLEGLRVGKLVEKPSDADFQKALEYVLEKNEDLYKKLK